MEFSCSASVPQFKFCTCILFYKVREEARKGRSSAQDYKKERSGMEVGRVERLGRETVGRGAVGERGPKREGLPL